MSDTAIKVENVSKAFLLPHEKQTSIKGLFLNMFHGRRVYERQQVLKNLSLEIKKGEFFGVVGRNGGGKSTLLKLLAGIYSPDAGQIQVNGKLTPFIELGVGFNPELTGRENVFLNGALLGFNRKEMLAMYDDIVAFAELEKFMDQKLKNYSSGMQVRLAFSVAIRAQSDILLIDEVLAVGDVNFQQKCLEIFRQLKDSPTTIVFVSHDLAATEEFCDRVALINDGELVTVGDAAETVMRYRSLMASQQSEETIEEDRAGTGEVRVLSLDVLSGNKKVKQLKAGEPFDVRIKYNAKKAISNPVFGLALVNRDGTIVTGPNTQEAGVTTGNINGQGEIRIHFKNNPFAPDRYTFMVGCFNEKHTVPYDFVRNAGALQIIGKERHGLIHLEPTWSTKRKAS